jgi:hypothetical protein
VSTGEFCTINAQLRCVAITNGYRYMFIKVGTRHKRAMSRYSDRRARFAVPDIQCVGELNSQADFSADVPRLAAVTLNPLRRC